MPIDVKCPKCSQQYRLKDELNGKKFKCKGCGSVVTARPIAPTGTGSTRATTPPRTPPGKAGPTATPTDQKPKRPRTPSSASQSRSDQPSAQRLTPARRPSRPNPAGPNPAKRQQQVDPFSDAYRDTNPDDLYAEPYDEADDEFAEPYDGETVDHYDDPFGSAPPKKRSGAKKSSSKSRNGLKWGFNPHGLNVAMTFGGIVLFVLGINESRLAAKSNAVPAEISLVELIDKGAGENIYLTVSGVEPQTGEFVYEQRSRGPLSSYSKVWIPCVPADSNQQQVKFLLFSTKASDDDAVGRLMDTRSHTGMIVNDIRGLGSDERRLLQSNLQGTNPDDVLIFEVGRTPSGAAARLAYFAGGVLLTLAGLAWILLGGESAATAAPVRSAATASPKKAVANAKRGRPLTLSQKLFSFQGRIGRGTFWGYSIAMYAAVIVSLLLIAVITAPLGPDSTIGKLVRVIGILGLTVVMAWSGIALQYKRWQDRGRPGIMFLVSFIPFIGAVWVVVECGCLPGTPGSNQYGPPPA